MTIENEILSQLSAKDKESIAYYLSSYHGRPIESALTFQSIIPYLPLMFEKIASNLECYLKQLERGDTLVD